eukprot:scaffold64724_cov22-Tisochrysis_lutea.AAC.1
MVMVMDHGEREREIHGDGSMVMVMDHVLRKCGQEPAAFQLVQGCDKADRTLSIIPGVEYWALEVLTAFGGCTGVSCVNNLRLVHTAVSGLEWFGQRLG